MTELNDHELLGQYARTQSEAAFAALVERYVNLVYSAALRFTGNPHHAQEITQAVFIVLSRKAGSLRSGTVLSGWLYETARLTASNFVKGEIRRQNREQEAYMQSTLTETESASAWEQIAPLLDEAMGRLGETDRNAIVLSFFENKTAREVGVNLKLNEEAAHKRVNRALEKLRKYFVKRGVTLSATFIAGAVAANSVQAAPVGLAVAVSATAVKGTAVAASTLTLAKGVLKIMAWTKAKMGIVAGVAILLATVGTVEVVNHFQQGSEITSSKLPTGNVTPMVRYGYFYGVCLASDGSLWSWGDQALGWTVLGQGNREHTASLRRVGSETNWTSIAVGWSHSLAIKSDGTLWGWGANFSGQLGDGTQTTRSRIVHSVPGNDWKQAAAGGQQSFGIKKDGNLWAWGGNISGEFGTGRPGEITGVVQVGSSTNWEKIWSASIQTFGLQSDGSLWFWGSMTGNGKDINQFPIPTRLSPDTNWVDGCFGYFTMFAIKSDGTLWSWGKEARFYTQAKDESSNSIPLQVGSENDWQSCSSSSGGFYQTLRKKDGSLWAMDASEHRRIRPDSEYNPIAFRKIELEKDVVAFAGCGDKTGVALTREGEIWTWGKVMGEHSHKDYFGPKGKSLDPELRVVAEPWRMSIIDSRR